MIPQSWCSISRFNLTLSNFIMYIWMALIRAESIEDHEIMKAARFSLALYFGRLIVAIFLFFSLKWSHFLAGYASMFGSFILKADFTFMSISQTRGVNRPPGVLIPLQSIHSSRAVLYRLFGTGRRHKQRSYSKMVGVLKVSMSERE